MSEVQMRRALVYQRLNPAAEEILGLFQTKLAEYEAQLTQSQLKNIRLQDLLHTVFDPEVRLHRAVFPEDVQQLLVWTPSLAQLETKPPQIKEEQEELLTSQEREQIQGLEETDITKFSFTLVNLKSENDEDNAQSLQLHQGQTEENTEKEPLSRSSPEQIKTEAGVDHCGAPESVINLGAGSPLQPVSDDNIADSSEFKTEVSDDDDWKESRGPRSTFITKVQMLRALMDQRLNAAVEEILGQFEGTLAEYEAEVTQSQQRSLRLRDQLRAVFNPEVRLHRAVFPEDVQQLLVWTTSLAQVETKPPQIKEEQEELLTSQEQEQIQGLEETDITKFSFTLVNLKSENYEDNAQSLQLHQGQTEENTEKEPLSRSSPEQTKTDAGEAHCGAPESVKNLGEGSPLQPVSDDNIGDSSEFTEVSDDDDDDWKESKEPRSTLNVLEKNRVCVSDMGLNTGKKSFSCTESSTTLKHKMTLKKQMQIHTREKLHSCSNCGKNFTRVGHLKVHMRVHTGEKPLSCHLCGKAFSQSGSLNRHMSVHTVKKQFSCSVCRKTFSQNRGLKRHMRIHTGEKLCSCSVCGKNFTMKGNLQIHMRVHTGEKPYSCSVCGKNLTKKGNLKVHMRVHTGEKPYRCSVCGKTFVDSEDLKRHMRIHTGEKPYSCSVCGKKFITQGNRKAHMRVHTGEKPYSCSVCKKSFSLRQILNIHTRIHTGEKPFSCTLCRKSFSQKIHLMKHMRVHTGEKPNRCSVCGKSFGQSGVLKRHMRIHTGEKRSVIDKSVAE